MEWSNTQVLQLIDLYKEQECLWNPKHDKHKSKTAKIDAWNQISEQIGSDTVEIKKKIESLLGSFRRERQKCDATYKTGTGTSDVYKSTWFAFKSMYFLMDKFRVRKTTNTEVSSKQDFCIIYSQFKFLLSIFMLPRYTAFV